MSTLDATAQVVLVDAIEWQKIPNVPFRVYDIDPNKIVPAWIGAGVNNLQFDILLKNIGTSASYLYCTVERVDLGLLFDEETQVEVQPDGGYVFAPQTDMLEGKQTFRIRVGHIVDGARVQDEEISVSVSSPVIVNYLVVAGVGIGIATIIYYVFKKMS